MKPSRRDRLLTAVRGGVLDRPPVSAWGHFFDRECDPQTFARATLDFHHRFDWDFVKVHARASYHVEGWGFRFEPSTDPARGHRCIGHPIASPADWRRIEPLPLDTPALAEQMLALDLIRAGLTPDTPIIMTVFSPLDVVEKLIDRDAAMLRRHIEEDPDAVEHALAAIAQTFAGFVGALARWGVDGIYFSTKWANDVKLPPGQYQRLVRPWDMQVLESARALPCNILHLCEDGVQLAAMADYPVAVLHWDAQGAHNPDFARGREQTGRAVGGGVSPALLANGTPQDVHLRARATIEALDGRGLVLGPGCSVQMARTPEANLRALRAAAQSC